MERSFAPGRKAEQEFPPRCSVSGFGIELLEDCAPLREIPVTMVGQALPERVLDSRCVKSGDTVRAIWPLLPATVV